tara:strand:+ start:2067 stop:2963 length:897 start_codon:yes stop_codon:yes gene_type:complete
MAFKMNPKSPLLMKAMGHASPAKQSVQGTNQTIQAEGKPEGPALTALEQAQQEANAAQMNRKVAQIKRNTAGTNKETARLGKRTARDNSATERKTKNAKKTQERVNERERSGKTRVGKVVAKIKEAISPAKQANVKAMSQPKKKTSKSKAGIKDVEPRRSKKSLKAGGEKSPAKQTAKQKANLPKEIVNAIAAKSPAKEIDKAGQRIIRQGEKAKAAYKAGDTKKGDRHKVRAKRMNGRYNAKMLKNNLKGGRDEVSKFEKNVEIAEKFDAKIEKAKGNTKKIARLTKRANRKMDRSN